MIAGPENLFGDAIVCMCIPTSSSSWYLCRVHMCNHHKLCCTYTSSSCHCCSCTRNDCSHPPSPVLVWLLVNPYQIQVLLLTSSQRHLCLSHKPSFYKSHLIHLPQQIFIRSSQVSKPLETNLPHLNSQILYSTYRRPLVAMPSVLPPHLHLVSAHPQQCSCYCFPLDIDSTSHRQHWHPILALFITTSLQWDCMLFVCIYIIKFIQSICENKVWMFTLSQ